MRVIFAKTRHEYGSYTDFWTLVQLAGYETCFVDQIDIDSDIVYITTPITGELKSRQLPKDRCCRIVWWNLERPDGEHSPDLTSVVDEALLHVDHIWVSDRWYASLDPRFKFVVLGSHEGLALPCEPQPRRYDYCHYSYVERRRNHIYGSLAARGLTGAPNGWGIERAVGVKSSAFVLNVHQTQAPIGEPLRFAWAAAYKAPMLSETIADPFPLRDCHDLMMAGYHELIHAAPLLARSDDANMGHNLHERLCIEWPFQRGVAEALTDLGGRL